jgi:hypothetical protein
MLSGCAAGRKQAAALRHSMAINMGVGAKKVTIGHKDLGRSFVGLKGTKYDFFSPKTPRSRRLSLSYHKFGIKSIDAFNRSATILIGKFKYTDNLVSKFIKDTRRFLKKDLKNIRLLDVNKSLRAKKLKKSATARTYQKLRSNFRGVLSNFKNVYGSLKKFKVSSARMIKFAPKELRKYPKRAIYADAIIGELSNRAKTLATLFTRGKSLAQRIRKLRTIMKRLDGETR